MLTQKTLTEEGLQPFAPLFTFSPPPPGLPSVNWATQERCLFYLRSALRSSNLPLFYFRGLFLALSFSPAILDAFYLF